MASPCSVAYVHVLRGVGVIYTWVLYKRHTPSAAIGIVPLQTAATWVCCQIDGRKAFSESLLVIPPPFW